MSEFTRFDLEQAIMRSWGTCEDIDDFIHTMFDSSMKGKPSEDDFMNAIMAIRNLHEARSIKLWDIFEECIQKREI